MRTATDVTNVVEACNMEGRQERLDGMLAQLESCEKALQVHARASPHGAPAGTGPQPQCARASQRAVALPSHLPQIFTPFPLPPARPMRRPPGLSGDQTHRVPALLLCRARGCAPPAGIRRLGVAAPLCAAHNAARRPGNQRTTTTAVNNSFTPCPSLHCPAQDLLDILSKGSNPQLILRHLPKNFDNVHNLSFRLDERGEPTKAATGMYSGEVRSWGDSVGAGRLAAGAFRCRR